MVGVLWRAVARLCSRTCVERAGMDGDVRHGTARHWSGQHRHEIRREWSACSWSRRGREPAGDRHEYLQPMAKRPTWQPASWPLAVCLSAALRACCRYLEPLVEESMEPFEWGLPDLDALRRCSAYSSPAGSSLGPVEFVLAAADINRVCVSLALQALPAQFRLDFG